ncbi:MAG: DUF1905 domain-containing protein [Clostridia bacterium]|nr:DUF1905 domain-containing protein [Clostridia bacterium]
MIYTFEGNKITEGNRTFIEIPFNVWDATGLKGNIPVKVTADNISFECKLVPKGNGRYFIPIKKAVAEKLNDIADVSFEPIDSLTRINHDSPYTKENPIRVIDSIEETELIAGFCGHGCVAMLAGVKLDDVLKVMGKEEGSWSKIMETLDYYGISYAPKMIYPKGKTFDMPKCCIAYFDGGFKLWFKGRYYGSNISGQPQITACLEIMTEGDKK